MNRILRFAFMLVCLAFAAGAAELTPEQANLNHYVGEWDGTLSSLPSAKIRISCEWILDCAFLRHSLSIEPAPGAKPISVMQLMTYDREKHTYRAWSFYSNGSSVQGEGAWDAAANTFTWTNRDEDSGTATVTKVSFPDGDTESTVSKTTDRDGKVVSEIRGTKTRRK